MTIFSASAPRPLIRTGASNEVARIRVEAFRKVPLDYEPPRLVRWFRLPLIIRILRHRLYLYMEEPTSSRAAMWINLFLTSCNILSVYTYCLESIPINNEDGVSNGVWFSWEVFLMSVFTLELICRAPAQTNFRQLVMSRPSIFVDFVACVPFDIYLFAGVHYAFLDTRWIRPIRLLRIVSLGNHILDLKLILSGLRRSQRMLALVWSLVMLVMVCFASVLFIVERGPWSAPNLCYFGTEDSQCTLFDSVPDSLYFAVEVASSVGYGDMMTQTLMGKFIAAVLMIVSVCTLALTIAVFSLQFERVYHKVQRSIVVESLRESTDLHMRASRFDESKGGIRGAEKFNDAACRLVAGIEVLQAVSGDLAKTLKEVRAELVLLSTIGTKGAKKTNPNLAKKSLPAVVEQSLVQLGTAAFNDVDTLTWFTLRTVEDLFVNGVLAQTERTPLPPHSPKYAIA